MNDTEYRTRTEKRLDSLLAVIEEQNQQITAADEFMRLVAPSMALLDGHKDTLAEKSAELLRAYVMAGGKKYLEGEKKS